MPGSILSAFMDAMKRDEGAVGEDDDERTVGIYKGKLKQFERGRV